MYGNVDRTHTFNIQITIQKMANSISDSNRNIEFIQVCRGIAALSIVIYHGRAFGAPGNLYEVTLRGLSFGVELFFIISGLVIVLTTSNVSRGTDSAIDFLIKRWSRVWPAYAVATLIMVTMAFMFNDPTSILKSPTETLTAIVKSLMFYPLQYGSFPPLGVGWTLNYEMYFYSLFAISLLLKKFRWFLLFGWLAITLVIIPEYTEVLSPGDESVYRYSIVYLHIVTSPLVWNFVAGVIVGLIYTSTFRIRNLYALNIIAFVSVCLTIWVVAFNIFPGDFALERTPFLAFMVLCLTLRQKEQRLQFPRYLTWLGDISYSVYLIHTIIYAFLGAFLKKSGLEIISEGQVLGWLAIIIVIPVSAIFHHYIEIKLSGVVRRYLFRIAGKKFQKRKVSPT